MNQSTRGRRRPRAVAAALAVSLLSALLAPAPVGAAAPSAPAAPTLTAGAQQLAASWTAPNNGGKAIDDYDVRYCSSSCSTDSNWTVLFEGGEYKTGNNFGTGQALDNVGPMDPLDMGSPDNLSAVSRVSVGGKSGVYRIDSAIDSMKITFVGGTVQYLDKNSDGTPTTMRLHSSTTTPTLSNLNANSTVLANVPVKYHNNDPNSNYYQYDLSLTTSTRLDVGSYFWFASSEDRSIKSRRLWLTEIDLPTTATSKTITELTDGTSYQVQVRAGNADGEGPWSASATETAGAKPAVPAAPTVASKDTSLDVSWTAPTANDPGGITDYDVQYRACTANCPADNPTQDSPNVSGATWGNWGTLGGSDDPGTSTSATIGSLTNGTLYQVQVRAENARGESDWSASTTTRPGLPNPPTAPTVTSDVWHTVNVNWTAPAANGPAVTAYIARAKPTDSTTIGWTHSPTAIAPATTAKIGKIPSPLNPLIADTAYSVQVRAQSSAGWGPWSSATSFRTRATIPDAPAAPTLVSDDAGLTASWTAPDDHDFDILDYDVRWSSDGGSTWTVLLDQECATVCSGTQAASDDSSDGPARNPLDLMDAGNSPYTFSGSSVTLTEETATSGSDGVYKLSAAVAGLYVKVTTEQETNSVDNTLVPLRARAAATKPGSGANLSTAGTEIWAVSPVSTGQDFSGSGWTLPLPANSYFWVAADSLKDYDAPAPSFNVRVASTATTRSVGSLTNGTTYHVQVRAGNEKGYGDWSPSATTVAGKPDAVAAPKLEAGVGQVRVNWDAPADRGSAITDYDLQYRSCTASCTTSTPTWGDWTDVSHTGTGRNATISSLTDGTSYQVQVRATNARGTGPWSPHASITVGVPAPPAAPTLASGNGSLTAGWTAPTNNGDAITDYDVQYCSTSCTTASNWTDAGHTGTGTSATISLTNGTAYQVQVRAANARGTGAWSPSATDTPGRPQQSSAPTLSTPAERQIHATWTATTANGLGVTDYDVQYSSDSGTTWTEWNASNTSTTTNATITGLTPNTSYQVQVRAESSAGAGAWSTSTSATTLTSAPDAPAAPQLSAGTTGGTQSLTVTWTAPADNGSAITDYNVQYSSDGGTTWTEWNASNTSTTTSATITGLTANTSYQVQVRATNGRGDSPWSASATALVGAPAQIATPTLTASAGQLAVAWTAPADNGAAINDYDVRYRTLGTSSWVLYDDLRYDSGTLGIPSPTSDTVDGPSGNPLDIGELNSALHPNTIVRKSLGGNAGVYQIKHDVDKLVFYFYDAARTGTGTTTLELRHHTDEPTSTTLHTDGRALGSSAKTGDSTNPLKTYIIDKTIKSTSAQPLSADSYFWLESSSSLTFHRPIIRLDVDLKSTGTSHTITGLTNGVAYEVQVRAGNSRGDGSWSASTQATMPSQPAAPAAPALTPGNKSLGVTWSSPADNGSSITDFDVQYSSDSGATWTEWKPSSTSTESADTITGLTNGTEYQVQVRATNAVGDSPWSASATATPQASTVRLPAPGVPGAITAVRTAGSAAVSWISPGGSYLKYQMLYREVSGDTWVPNPSYPSSGWISVPGTQSATSATFTSWDDTKTYVVAVRARDHATGLYGSWGISDLLPPAGTPPRVSDIEVIRSTVGGSHVMRVTWDKLSDSTVSSYESAWSADTSPRSWQTALTMQASACTTTCTQPFLADPSKNYVVRVRSVTSANKHSHWVESSPSYPLDIENLSAERVLTGTDPSYVEQRPLDVVVTWDPVTAAANVSYRVRMQYRSGNPASYYDGGGNNNVPDAMPDDWTMDWQWYAWCKDGDDDTNPPNGGTKPSNNRGCKDPYTESEPYLKPVWAFATAPEWSATKTVNAMSCTSNECSYTFADSTVGGTSVKVEVWAVDSSNTSGPVATFTTHPKRPPGEPLSVTTVAPSGASVQAQWVQAYDSGSPVIGFDVRLLRCTVTPNACVVHATVTGTKGTPLPDANRDPRDKPVLSYTFHDSSTYTLPTNTHYKIMVRAQNIEGYSGWEVARDDVELTPTKPPPPAPPTVSISGTTATVTWMAPADDGGSAVTGYLVQYRKKGAGGIWSDTWTDHTYSGTVCSRTASCSTTVTVDAGSTVPDYQFRVAATNSIATGGDRYSSVGAPGAPTGVVATATAGGVSVTWTQPADIGTSAIIAADIRTRVSSPQGAWSDPQTPATNPGTSPAVITGLTAGTAYDVQIRVRNANGAGAWVDAGTVTPT